MLLRRNHPGQYQSVTVPLAVDLSPQQVDEIFRMRLEELTKDCRMDTDGRLIQVVGIHPHNGENIEESFKGDIVDMTLIYGVLGLKLALKNYEDSFKR